MTTVSPNNRLCFVSALSWPQVEQALRDGATAVLPVGAGAKEHGRHLPLATDQIQAEWIARQLARKHDLLIWPTVTYGHYPAFLDYPGSCSITEEVFQALVAQVVSAILGQGATRLCLLNTGVSTRPALDKVAATTGALLINVYDGPRCRHLTGTLLEQPAGGHADERETSIMLAIEPDAVDMEQASRCVSRMQAGALRRRDCHHPNYSPSGVIGDATLATAAKGERFLAAILADVDEALTLAPR